MAEYHVGDHVRIVSEWNNECYQNPEGLMDHWLGAIMTIKSWNGLSYQMEEDVGEYGENYGWSWFPAAIAGLADAAENNEELLEEIEYNVGDQVRIVAEFKDRTTWDSRCRESWLGKIMTIDQKIVVHTTQGIKYIYYMDEDGSCWSWESKDIAGIEKESFVQGVYYEPGNRVKVVSEWTTMKKHPNGLLGQVVTILKRHIDFNAKGARWAYHVKEDFLEGTWHSDDFVGIASPEEDPMNKYHEGDEVRIVSEIDSMCIFNDGVVKWLGKKMTIHAKYSNYFRMKEDQTIHSSGSRWYPFLIRGLESEVRAQEAKEVDLTKEAMVLHFRIGTAGGNTPQNTHPFPVMDSIGALKKLKMSVPIGVAHNGIIPVTPRTKDISDTMEYVASQLAPLYRAVPKFYQDKNLMTLIKNAIKSKMAFLIGDGSIYTIGDFEEEGGLLFSNHTYAYGYVPAYRNSFGYYYGAEDEGWNKYYGWGEDKDTLIIERPLMLLDDGEYMVELDTGEFADTSMGLYFIDENGSCYMYDDAEEACLPLDTFTAFNAQGLSLKFDMSRAEVMEVML